MRPYVAFRELFSALNRALRGHPGPTARSQDYRLWGEFNLGRVFAKETKLTGTRVGDSIPKRGRSAPVDLRDRRPTSESFASVPLPF